MRFWIILCLVWSLCGCTVITIVDAAASAVVKTVETAVDWVIPN